jgi:uncharacterized membrane protein YccF (DUF307 family)
MPEPDKSTPIVTERKESTYATLTLDGNSQGQIPVERLSNLESVPAPAFDNNRDVNCQSCGARIASQDDFCGQCGAPTLAKSMPPAASVTMANAWPKPIPAALPTTPVVNASPAIPVAIPSQPIHVSPVIVIPKTKQHSFVVRALWFLFVGWWLSAAVIALGYLSCWTLIGIPIGFKLFNIVPQALTLRQRTVTAHVAEQNGAQVIQFGDEKQRPLWQRIIYFLLIGFWFGAIWSVIGWMFSVILLTLPLGVWMLNRIGAVMTLHRH